MLCFGSVYLFSHTKIRNEPFVQSKEFTVSNRKEGGRDEGRERERERELEQDYSREYPKNTLSD